MLFIAFPNDIGEKFVDMIDTQTIHKGTLALSIFICKGRAFEIGQALTRLFHIGAVAEGGETDKGFPRGTEA
jgi:hypothetical protein